MKKQIILAAALLFAGVALNAQVGVGTDDPKATLEIVGETTANVADGVLIPRFTEEELDDKGAAYGAPQNGTLVFVTEDSGALSGKTSNITSSGFHYYDSATSKWVAVGGGASTPAVLNFKESNGDLTSSTWTATDDIMIVTNTTSTILLPDATANEGRVIYVNNQSGGTRNYGGSDTKFKPVNTSNITAGKGQMIYSNGTAWYIIGGY